MDNYATHLPFLSFLVQEFKPGHVIEFGMGKYSTPLLLEGSRHLTSIESNEEWFNKSKSVDNPNHTQILWSEENVQDYLLANRVEYDLAFVDGPTLSRVPCVQRLFDRSSMIVFHDSTTRCYHWEKLNVPKDYKRYDYLSLSPTTSVFVQDRYSDTFPIIEKYLKDN